MFKKKIEIHEYLKHFIRSILSADDTLNVIRTDVFKEDQINKISSKMGIIRLMFLYGIFLDQKNSKKIPNFSTDKNFLDVFVSCLIISANEIKFEDDKLNVLLENFKICVQSFNNYLIKNDVFLRQKNIYKYSELDIF
jgi:hypothetical protein